MVYSMQEVAGLTQYAADRGVRLLVEVDVPGHAASWLKGYPQIMATCIQKYTNVNNYALNPVLEETYEVVGAVLKDIIQTTGAKLFHVGGDVSARVITISAISAYLFFSSRRKWCTAVGRKMPV